jgi:PAS domain S-box-containing protein
MARYKDVTLYVFPGESIKVPYGYAHQCNVIYDLIDKKKLDAFIWSTSTLGNFISREELENFLYKYRDIPSISLSVPFRGIPSILIDNEKGIREAVCHLIHDHGRKRIAFISGPAANYEARVRCEAYKAALEENKFGVDDNLIVEGFFNTASGTQAMFEFCDKRKIPFDALIASNDVMAIGAMRELQRRGISVPDDVAIIGFDNVIRCLNVFPALASIKQPLYQQAGLALNMAIDLARGRNVAELTVLPTALVIRPSCGCFSAASRITQNLQAKRTTVPVQNFSYQNKYFENEIDQMIQSVDYLGAEIGVIKACVWEVIGRLESVLSEKCDFSLMLKTLTHTLFEHIKKGINVSFWYPIFLSLAEYAFQFFKDDSKSGQVTRYFYETLNVIQENIRATEISQRLLIENNEVRLSLDQHIISSSLTVEEILLNCTKYIPEYDINSFYIFRYFEKKKHFRGDTWDVPEEVSLICAFDRETGLRLIQREGIVCSTKDLIPDAYCAGKKSGVYFVFPIHFLEDQYGYIIYEMGTPDPNIYDFFRHLLGNSFYTANVLERRVTAEKDLTRALKDLKSKTEEYRTLSENLPDIIVRINTRHAISYISPNITTIVNKNAEEMIGMPVRVMELFTTIRNDIDEVLGGVFRSKTNAEIEFKYEKSGARIYNIRFVPEFNENHDVISILGITRDITELKKIEERLLHMEKIQAIGELAGGIAHDFNNQLAVIIGTIDIMRTSGKYDRATMQYINNIYHSANQAATLTNQLLAFARKGKFLNTEINVHRILADVISLITNTIGRNIVLETDFKAKSEIIMGDPSQLQNAILNLCINAVDAMPNGGRVTVSTKDVVLDKKYFNQNTFKIAPGPFISVCIHDEGVGMSEEVRKHIFEPFFTTKAPGKGTGMGLAAVYGTVRNHRGAIEFETKEGAGTTFALYFPASKTVPEEAVEELAAADEAAVQTAVQGKLKSLHILLIDDEEIVRKVTTEILKRLGHRVTSCADGFEALDIFKKQKDKIDLVLLDLIMPGLSGEKTYWGIRALSNTIKVVLISGYSLNEQVQGLLDAGASEFIQKPFSRAKLAKVISLVVS